MAQLFQAVKSILYFVILIAFTEIIMPNVRYKKYIKMVMGMILILMILTPLASFLGGRGAGFDYADAFAGSLRAAENSHGADQRELDAQWRSMLKSAFDEQVKAQLSSFARGEGFELIEARVETDAGMSQITRIDATVRETSPARPEKKGIIRIEPVIIGDGSRPDNADTADRLKKTVSDFYKIPADSIHINVHRKTETEN